LPGIFCTASWWISEGKDNLDEGSLSSLGLIVLLIGLHGGIALAYAALTNSRDSELRSQVEARGGASPRLHITYQLSLMLLQFAIAAVSVIGIGQTLVAQSATLAPLVIYILVLLPTALITLILGYFVPDAIGSARSLKLAAPSSMFLRLLIFVMQPITVVIIALSKWMSFGSGTMVNVFTEEEIMTLLDAGEKEGTIENEEKEMIYSVLQLDETIAREVMIPRIDIAALDIHTPLHEALKVFLESGHSRVPVYEESIDNIVGLLYAKDLLTCWAEGVTDKPIRDMLRKAFFVPETKRADLLLKELQTGKIHLAVVVDEYGGTAGLVTIEDLLEEIVGDIQDEYDLDEEADYIQHGPNEYMMDASINLDDVNDLLDIELPTEDSDTLGGYIFSQLGRVPSVGETIESGNIVMRVDALEGRRIRKVYVARTPSPSEERPAPATGDNPSAQPQTAAGTH
jgi:CBS domain containing-hemolysin-like protein